MGRGHKMNNSVVPDHPVAGLAVAVTQNQSARTDSSMNITERINRGDVERLLGRLDQLSDQEADAVLSDVFTQQELHE
jgi:hypothetical protein